MHQHAGHGSLDFWTLVNPGYLLFTVILIVLYFAVIGPWRDRFGGKEEVSLGQKIGFVSGLVLFYLASGPVYAYGHSLFSAHMLWMSIVYLAVPPLLLYGSPPWLLRPLWKSKAFARIFSLLTHPLIAIVLFNGLISIYHLPVVFDAIMVNSWWMGVSHIILAIASFLMWWPVMCPIPEQDRLGPLQKMAYIFADGVLLTPACAIIAFSQVLLYDFYQGAPQVFSFLTLGDDQSLGGVLMKIVQEIVYGWVLGYNFFRWVRQHKQKEREEQQAIRNSGEAAAASSPALHPNV
ncbi:cytochrome c oxidase assembly protein [Paludifilum halophilum]|uniref:Cytochrome c oxidase assembly factor CtaG n=1 Tax=Paludifilum halophilum TaxID=1642702 RepID=A0A235B414_9BACL|nr:cytochrome c oxidase assembly protein [Paludifilum halophilum]OYD07013.1 hypothetical protein CHM34_13865 [Paludifilum halophilum]